MLRLGPGASRYYIEMRCLEIKEDGTLVPSSMKWLNRNFRHTSPVRINCVCCRVYVARDLHGCIQLFL